MIYASCIFVLFINKRPDYEFVPYAEWDAELHSPGGKKKKKRLRKRDLETHHFFLGSKENKYTLQGAAVFFQCADSDLLLSPSVQTGKCSGLRGLTAF